MQAAKKELPPSESFHNPRQLPIAVDLDGTLSRSDTLHELLVRTALRHPLRLFCLLPSLAKSRAKFKSELGRIALDETPTAPWNPSVVSALGDPFPPETVLCTASNQGYAQRVCGGRFPFSSIFGSDATTNLKGAGKAAFLRERYGRRGFVYFGNDITDLEVWKEAAKAFVVSDDPNLVEAARKVCPAVEQIPVGRPPALLSIARLLRPHQWSKNLLVFVPLLTSHRFGERPLILACAAAFAIFCLLTSSVYVLNDAIDLDADRQHPTKKQRPFASGDLSVAFAVPLFAVLAGGGLSLSFLVGKPFALVCGAYLLLTTLYSTVLKKLALLDVFALATLYTLRLLAGSSATAIVISVWLGAFSIFIFLSLALCKRYVEIGDVRESSAPRLLRRGYLASDGPFVLAQGLIYMGCATLVLAVYLSSSAVTLLYKTPSILWLAVLVVLFWGSRLWLLTFRKQMHDDPVLFALKDPVSWTCLGVLLAVFGAAMTLALE